MAVLPKALLWRRLDGIGSEHALVDDAAGLHARGTMTAAEPVPFVCRYELYTDDTWVTARFDVAVEGAGFLRTVRLERAAGRWRVTASEQGNLDATLTAAGRPRAGLPGSEDPARLARALDVDLGYSPLTNTLPVRRLGLHEGGRGSGAAQPVEVAWVLLPGLEVVPSTQTYARLDERGGGEARLIPQADDRARNERGGGEARLIRFTSGSFTADITVDSSGFVTHYPGLAERAG